MKIKKIKLSNCQSWSDASPLIELSNDKINIIDADNETGKSVLWKMLITMCFPHNGYVINDLIRRDCDRAQLIFIMEDNTVVSFCIVRGRGYVYYLREPNGTERKWVFALKDPDAQIPDELEEILELILDRKSQTVVNVVEKERQPFINRTPEADARVFATVLEDSTMEQTIENMENFRDKTIECIKCINRDSSINRDMLRHYPAVDILQLKLVADKKEKFIKFAEVPYDLNEDLTQLRDLVNNKPTAIESDSRIDELYSIYSILFTDSFNEYSNLKSSKPKSLIKSIPELDELDNLLTNIQGIECDTRSLIEYKKDKPVKIRSRLKALTSVSKLYDESISIQSDIENINNLQLKQINEIKSNNESCMTECMSVYKQLNSITDELNNLKAIETPTLIKDNVELSKLNLLLSLIPSYETVNLFNAVNGIRRCNERIEKLTRDFNEFKLRVKVCPTCGQKLEDK